MIRFIFLTIMLVATMPKAHASEEKLFPAIFAEHLTLLKHLDVPHDPYLVMFSATPGMGKTTIAKELESRLEAIRLSSDDVRLLFAKYQLSIHQIDPKTQQSLLIAYLFYCVQQLMTLSPNHHIILDMSVDRYYPLVIKHATQNQWGTFVIRLVVPREIVEERICQREPNPEPYLKHMDKWFADYQAFDLNAVDYFLDNSKTTAEIDFEDLIETMLDTALCDDAHS